MKGNLETLAESVFVAVKGYCSTEFVRTFDRLIEPFKKQIETLPVPSDGKDGKDGSPGADADAEAITKQVLEQVTVALEQIPAPKDGRDGKDADAALIRAVVKEEVSHLRDGMEGDACVSDDDCDPDNCTCVDGVCTQTEAMADKKAAPIVAKVLALLPAPVPGKDADAALVQPLVASEVTRALAEWPKPRDGSNGADGKSVDMVQLAGEIAAAAAKAVSSLPPPKDGKDADAEAITQTVLGAVSKFLDAIPAPKDGRDADQQEVTRSIAEEVTRAVAALPKPTDGAAGLDGKDASPEQIAGVVVVELAKAIATLPPPKDGRDGQDASLDAVAALIEGRVAKAIALIPAPKDGINGKDADVELVRAEVQRAVDAFPKPVDGRDGRDGKGEPGRDALQCERLSSIDVTRSYPRATYANYRGGVIRSVRTTEPITDTIEAAGWVVDTEGEHDFEIEQVNERTFSFKKTFTSGRVVQKSITIPSQIYRGVYLEDKVYEQGDTVTWGGGQWYCKNDGVTEKPFFGSKVWSLSVKPGRDGKDGVLITPKAPGTIRV